MVLAMAHQRLGSHGVLTTRRRHLPVALSEGPSNTMVAAATARYARHLSMTGRAATGAVQAAQQDVATSRYCGYDLPQSMGAFFLLIWFQACIGARMRARDLGGFGSVSQRMLDAHGVMRSDDGAATNGRAHSSGVNSGQMY
jgi:hypothetical protein